jgi:hypothetical protein
VLGLWPSHVSALGAYGKERAAQAAFPLSSFCFARRAQRPAGPGARPPARPPPTASLAPPLLRAARSALRHPALLPRVEVALLRSVFVFRDPKCTQSATALLLEGGAARRRRRSRAAPWPWLLAVAGPWLAG